MTRIFSVSAAFVFAAAILIASYILVDLPNGRNLSFSLITGSAFGFVLQRGRFCFLCNTRDFLYHGDARGAVSILVALGAGAVGYSVIFGAWLPTPALERLPPTAHIGPVSLALCFAAFVFGIGMALSGSCISAQLYRFGEGSLLAPITLIGVSAGFVIGFLTWNWIYLVSISDGVVIWLPHTLGYGGTLLVTAGSLAWLAALVLRFSKTNSGPSLSSTSPESRLFSTVFRDRWPPVLTGVLVGCIATIAYLRVAPLGVTAELGSLSRAGAAASGLLPETLYGLDGFRGCSTVVRRLLLSENGMFVTGLILASFASALLSGQFRIAVPGLRQGAQGLLGGVLMGWGAMTALGCTVGVLLSGIHAGALSGWVFFVFCFVGTVLGLKVLQPKLKR